MIMAPQYCYHNINFVNNNLAPKKVINKDSLIKVKQFRSPTSGRDIPNQFLITEETNDNRSYHINSDKIKEKLKFSPKFTIKEAVYSLLYAFEKNKLKNTFENDIYHNVKRMQNLKVE